MKKNTKFEFLDNTEVKGNNTSLWGKSGGRYSLQRGVYRAILKSPNDDFFGVDEESEPDSVWGELQVFGENTDWFQYTDEEIERQMKNLIDNAVPAHFKGYKLKSFSWSEQGMQPDKGWSFDMEIEKAQPEMF